MYSGVWSSRDDDCRFMLFDGKESAELSTGARFMKNTEGASLLSLRTLEVLVKNLNTRCVEVWIFFSVVCSAPRSPSPSFPQTVLKPDGIRLTALPAELTHVVLASIPPLLQAPTPGDCLALVCLANSNRQIFHSLILMYSPGSVRLPHSVGPCVWLLCFFINPPALHACTAYPSSTVHGAGEFGRGVFLSCCE